MSKPESFLDDDITEIEADIARRLRGVRYVFELGFPTELVAKARLVVEKAIRRNTLEGRGRHINYPASLALSVIAAAREYDGNALWQSDLTEFIRLKPSERADLTFRSLKQLRLDTFTQLIEAENALLKITPVLMHAGIPTQNLPELLKLINTAQRRHLFSAREQIQLWRRSPSGFRGLWRAPELFLKYGGTAAEDFLDRLNEALALPEPHSDALPSHINDALGNLDDALLRSVQATATRLGRPNIAIDPWQSDGPFISLPSVDLSQVNRWDLSFASVTTPPARRHETRIPLLPPNGGEWQLRATHGSTVARQWIFPAYGSLPVIFFDGTSGRLLHHQGKVRRVESSTTLALIDRRVELVDASTSPEGLPQLYGPWRDWQLVEINTRNVCQLTIRTIGDSDRAETITLLPSARRPELLTENRVANVLVGNALVYSRPPLLDIAVGTVDKAQVTVTTVDQSGTTLTRTLREFDGDSPIDLAPLFPIGGTYTLRVDGPLGLRLAPTQLSVIPELTVGFHPMPALPTDEVVITLASAHSSSSHTVGANEESANVDHESTIFEVVIPRVSWMLRHSDQTDLTNANREFGLALDELAPPQAPQLSIDLGTDSFSKLELLSSGRVVQEFLPPRRVRRWTVDLSVFNDTAEASSVESLQVRLVAGNRLVMLGAISAVYRPKVSEVAADPSIEPAVITARLVENRAFKHRVVRVWDSQRPWLPSFTINVPQDQRTYLSLPFPPDHRASTYRCWLRIEEAWAASPSYPPTHTPGVFDIVIESGVPLDHDDVGDRVIGAIREPNRTPPSQDDIAAVGHLLIARLANELRSNGTKWLTTAEGGRLFELLRQTDSHQLPNSLVRALNDGYLDGGAAFETSVALLPLLRHLEFRLDLQVANDLSEHLWGKMPLAAAVIEQWYESPENLERWMRYVGWPAIVRDGDDRPSDLALDHLPPIPDLPKQIRMARHNPEFLNYWTAAFAGFSDQPLSVDVRMRGVIEALTGFDEAARSRWLNRHSVTLNGAHDAAKSGPFMSWINQLSLGNTPNDRWILADVAALACAVVTPGPQSGAQFALLDVVAPLHSWVAYCLHYVVAELSLAEPSDLLRSQLFNEDPHA